MSRGGAPLKAPQGVTGHSALYVRLDPARRTRLTKLVTLHRDRAQVATVTMADVVRLLIDAGYDNIVRSGGRRG